MARGCRKSYFIKKAEINYAQFLMFLCSLSMNLAIFKLNHSTVRREEGGDSGVYVDRLAHTREKLGGENEPRGRRAFF